MATPTTAAAPPPPPRKAPTRALSPTASDARTPPEPRPQHPAKPAAATPTASPAASDPPRQKNHPPTDPVHPQQIPPRLRHNPFDTVSRRPVPANPPTPNRQPRQRRAVTFPLGVTGNPSSHTTYRRHHVTPATPPANAAATPPCPRSHRVAHQTVAPRHHRRLPRQPAPHHRRLDLSRLDPVTPHLHLAVAPPDILKNPVLPPPRHIPRPVQPTPATAIAVRHKPRRRQTAATAITPRQPNPANTQLPHNPKPNQPITSRPTRRPEAPAPAPPIGTHAVPVALRAMPRRGVDRGLGRAIEIMQLQPSRRAPATAPPAPAATPRRR